MIQILQQLAHLNTVRESLDIISNSITSLKEGVNNIDFASVIDKIEETTAELSNKIEGIQIDTTDLAKELTLTDGVNTLAGMIDQVSDAQAQIDQLIAIQLQTIIG